MTPRWEHLESALAELRIAREHVTDADELLRHGLSEAHHHIGRAIEVVRAEMQREEAKA